MLFKLHYWFLDACTIAVGILLGVYLETYTDANAAEIGTLLMLMPLTGIIFKPIICSKADREQAHKYYLLICLILMVICYSPFVIIPLLGPQFYHNHSNICWYLLILPKLLGDIAYGGVVSLGDTLAINYAQRIGVEFSVFRMWGTISWMCNGFLIGQINEIWFLPKYVPGFLVLISFAFLDFTIILLWPDDYFIIVNKDTLKENEQKHQAQQKKLGRLETLKKSLAPRDVIYNHMKRKLLSLVTFNRHCIDDLQIHNQNNHDTSKKESTGMKTNTTHQQINLNLQTIEVFDSNNPKRKKLAIDKTTQLKMLLLLFQKDPRIILYLIFFILVGLSLAPVSYVFIGLAGICNQQKNGCDFSQLAGLSQVSMGLVETITLLYMKKIKSRIGRVNTCAIALFASFTRYTFYSFYWAQVDAYYTLIFESLHGLLYGIYFSMMAEVGLGFASEVKLILPELKSRSVLDGNEIIEVDNLNFSLRATIQSLISIAMDGIGRGLGVFLYGIILYEYSYETLWFSLSLGAFAALFVTLGINLFDFIFKFRIGQGITNKLESTSW